jgi:HSP20 family molecular chaperone IbpA
MDEAEHGAEPGQYVPVNIAVHRGRVLVTAPLAGCNLHNIRVGLEGNRLDLEAQPMGGQNMDYLVHEWHPGLYRRSVELPLPVTGEGAFAHYGNGLLIVHLEKAEKVQPEASYSIEVTTPSHEEVHPGEKRN